MKEKVFKYLAKISDDRFYPPNILQKETGEEIVYKGWRKRVAEVLNKDIADNFNLYIHIPYCQTYCRFCRFSIKVTNSKKELGEYLELLKRETKRLSPIFKKIEFKTIYLGGGTPTIFSTRQLGDLFKTLEDNFNVGKTVQRIIEATPLTLSKDKLELLRKYNFDRLTIGIQTVDQKLVKKINRDGQTKKAVEEVVLEARKKGIRSINMDLLGGLPEQTVESFLDSLKFILKLKPEALHIYSYKEEDAIPFCRMGVRVTEKEKNSRKEMFFLADKLIRETGYRSYRNEPYLLSPWAANMQWQAVQAGGSLLGIGAGAESYIPNNFYYENPILKEYSARNNFKRAVAISKEETMANYALNNIRTGVERKRFSKVFRSDFDKIFGKEIAYLKKRGKISDDGEAVKFNAKNNHDFRVYSKIFFSDKNIKKIEEATKKREAISKRKIFNNKLIGSPAES